MYSLMQFCLVAFAVAFSAWSDVGLAEVRREDAECRLKMCKVSFGEASIDKDVNK